jgi:hypothetical protein
VIFSDVCSDTADRSRQLDGLILQKIHQFCFVLTCLDLGFHPCENACRLTGKGKTVYMMISPEGYGLELKGKNRKELEEEVRRLIEEIRDMKRKAEDPEDGCHMIAPGPDVIISMDREYLEVARKALKKAGGTIVYTQTEKNDSAFRARIPLISELILIVQSGYGDTEKDILHVDPASVKVIRSFAIHTEDNRKEIYPCDRTEFENTLNELHIGEWQGRYEKEDSTVIMNWKFSICYNDGTELRYSGRNAAPYNFDRLKDLMSGEI